MYTGFSQHLGFEDQKRLQNEFIGVFDLNIDGSFILHHFISHALSNSTCVVLCGFAQTLTHYSNACHKLGINLHTSTEKKQFQFIDVLSMINDGFSEESILNSNPFLKSNNSSSTSLQNLYDLIKSHISSTPTLILLDDLSLLINIGIPVQHIADFIHYCKVLTVETNVSVVILTHSAENDPDYSMVVSYLQSYATSSISIQALKTGYSKDLSGEMNIRKHSTTTPFINTNQLHFKLYDKDVKFYAPGMSSAVL